MWSCQMKWIDVPETWPVCLLLGSDGVKAIVAPSQRRKGEKFGKSCFVKWREKSIATSIWAGKKLLLRVIFQIQNCCRRKINHIRVNTKDRHKGNTIGRWLGLTMNFVLTLFTFAIDSIHFILALVEQLFCPCVYWYQPIENYLILFEHNTIMSVKNHCLWGMYIFLLHQFSEIQFYYLWFETLFTFSEPFKKNKIYTVNSRMVPFIKTMYV